MFVFVMTLMFSICTQYITRGILALVSKPRSGTAYLRMSMSLFHPQAGIEEMHMLTFFWSYWRPQATLLLPALKPTEIW